MERMHRSLGNLAPKEYAGPLSSRSSEGETLSAASKSGRDNIVGVRPAGADLQESVGGATMPI
jgi:hypothetical protein